MKLGIMGGTFNPIHNGHLFIGESAREALQLDEVVYIPTGKPGHKAGKKIVDGEKRFQMVSFAIDSNPNFTISDIEIDRDGVTYTIDTMKKILKSKRFRKIYFIIGEDSLYHLEKWKRFEELINLCDFIVFQRNIGTEEKIREKIKWLEDNFPVNINYVKSPIFEISSTIIRERMKLGKSIKYLVPDKVEKFIIQNDLYREG